MQSITSLESVQLQSYLHVNDCIFCCLVLSDVYKHSLFVVVVHVIYAPVMLKSYREEQLVSAELGTHQKLNLNRFKDPTLLDFFSNFPV